MALPPCIILFQFRAGQPRSLQLYQRQRGSVYRRPVQKSSYHYYDDAWQVVGLTTVIWSDLWRSASLQKPSRTGRETTFTECRFVTKDLKLNPAVRTFTIQFEDFELTGLRPGSSVVDQSAYCRLEKTVEPRCSAGISASRRYPLQARNPQKNEGERKNSRFVIGRVRRSRSNYWRLRSSVRARRAPSRPDVERFGHAPDRSPVS